MKSPMIAAFLAATEAVKLDPFMTMMTPKLEPTRPLAFHENEDMNSVPDPMTNKYYMTSTQAKLLRNNQDDLAYEPTGLDPQFHVAFNKGVPEPVDKQYGDADGASGRNGFAWVAYVQTGDDVPEEVNNVQLGNKWMVDADYGENDENMVPREAYADDVSQTKGSGWSNPLAWTDDGNDDDKVLAQQKSKIRLIGADDITLVQIMDDDEEEDEEENQLSVEEANMTAESIVTEHKVMVDRGFGDEDVI